MSPAPGSRLFRPSSPFPRARKVRATSQRSQTTRPASSTSVPPRERLDKRRWAREENGNRGAEAEERPVGDRGAEAGTAGHEEADRPEPARDDTEDERTDDVAPEQAAEHPGELHVAHPHPAAHQHVEEEEHRERRS